jgi:hypothetical protein
VNAIRFFKLLQEFSDPDFSFRATVNRTCVLGMREELFFEFRNAAQDVQPQQLRRIELNDVWFLRKGEIRISTCELVVPERLLVGESGGPIRARSVVRLADACIREGVRLSRGELSVSALWRSEAAMLGEVEREAEGTAKDWFFSNFYVNR